jgi:hypothetical protein
VCGITHDQPRMLELFSIFYARRAYVAFEKGRRQKTFSQRMREEFSCDAVKLEVNALAFPLSPTIQRDGL